MFRRSRMLLILLVLLVIVLPVLYILLTWNPYAPQRVTCVAQRLVKSKYGTRRELQIEVTNPCPCPFYMYSCFLLHPDPLKRGSSSNFTSEVPSPWQPSNLPSGGQYPAYIPACGSARFLVRNGGDFEEQLLKAGGCRVTIFGLSSTKIHLMNWLDRALEPLTGIANSFSNRCSYPEVHTYMEVSGPVPTVTIVE